jgi:hypothetical protein
VIERLSTQLNVSVSCGVGRAGTGCKVRLSVSPFQSFGDPVSMVVSVLAGAKRQRSLDKLGFRPNHDVSILFGILADYHKSRVLLLFAGRVSHRLRLYKWSDQSEVGSSGN